MNNNVPELRFGEFVDDWIRDKLGSLLIIRSASRVHKDEWTERGVPFFRSSDVVANYKGTINKKAFISNQLFNKLSDKTGKIKKNDILVTGGGSIGIPYLVPNDDPLYFKDADLLLFKQLEKIDNCFLYLYLSTTIFRRYLTSVTHIGTIAHYTIEQAKSTPIIYPSLLEQQKIANFLTSVDQHISLLKQKKAALEQYKKGLMQKIFSQEIRFKYDDGEDYPDWEFRTLKEICSLITYGLTVRPSYYENGIPLISAREIKTGSIDMDNAPRINRKDYECLPQKTKPQIHDIFLSKTGTIGFSAIYQSEIKIAITQNIAILRLATIKNSLPLFILYYLKTQSFL